MKPTLQPSTPTVKNAVTAWAVLGLVFSVLIFAATWTAGIISGNEVELSEGFMVLFGTSVAALGAVFVTKGYYRTGRLALGVCSLIVLLLMVAAMSLIPAYFMVEVGIPTEILGLFGVAVVALQGLLKPGA